MISDGKCFSFFLRLYFFKRATQISLSRLMLHIFIFSFERACQDAVHDRVLFFKLRFVFIIYIDTYIVRQPFSEDF